MHNRRRRVRGVMSTTFRVVGAIALIAVILWAGAARAETYRFGVPPFMPTDQLVRTYQPLVDYLAQATGHNIILAPAASFPLHWQRLQTDFWDLQFNPAHLTDYILRFHNHRLVVKHQGQLSFTLVTSDRQPAMEPEDLTGQPVAVPAPPSMGSVQLELLYPDPVHYPHVVEVAHAIEAIARVRSGTVVGAYIPSPLVAGFPQLHTVHTTDPFPHFGLTASDRVPPEVVSRISHALLTANATAAGQQMLHASALVGFETAERSIYASYYRWLKSMWGYRGD